MFNKIYDKLKKIIRESKVEIIVFICLFLFCFIPLPYYIDMPGGLLDTKKRVEIENQTKSEGSFNLAYVSEIQATPLFYVLALLNKNWDIIEKEDMVLEGQTIEDLYTYNRLLLKQSQVSAKIVAYDKANKTYEIKNDKLVVAYVTENAITDLEVGDIIISLDDKLVHSFDDISNIIQEKEVGETIRFQVESSGKNKEKEAQIIFDETKMVGISILSTKDVITNPDCNLSNESKESGPSGGLMTALTIYDYLIEEDLTKGFVIAGTGTIDENGNVGSIGGVKYKLKGVVNKKADVFLVPAGKNYEEAIKYKKENNYDIEIVSVATFDDAIKYLRTLEKR